MGENGERRSNGGKWREEEQWGKMERGDEPVEEGVLDVVGSGVDKNTTLIPRATLHPHVLVDLTQTLQLLGADVDVCGGMTLCGMVWCGVVV